jgi:adenylosuccinate lyase
MAAARRMKEEGADADLLERIADDEAFGLTREELDGMVDPSRFVGRAPVQVTSFLDEHVTPTLARPGRHAPIIAEPEIHV